VLIVCAAYYAVSRLVRSLSRARERRNTAGGETAAAPAPDAPPADPPSAQIGLEPPLPSPGELLPIRDWAFEYERMVLSDMAGAERERAIQLVSRFVVPLVGHLRVCELNDELVRSFGHVLAAQAGPDQARYVARRWAHLVGWVRYQAAPPERRNIWMFLDPAVDQLYDELDDG
jgi:hypothetical protein